MTTRKAFWTSCAAWAGWIAVFAFFVYACSEMGAR